MNESKGKTIPENTRILLSMNFQVVTSKIVFKLTLAANLEPKFSIQNILNELCYVICELCI